MKSKISIQLKFLIEMNKFFKENTLLNQEFIKETKTSVSQYLNKIEKDLTVTDFKRVGLGV